MPGRDEDAWGFESSKGRGQRGLLASALSVAGRALEAEADRWFLWLPVLFAGGILAYFALSYEPEARVAVSLVLGALGLCLAARQAPLGLALCGAFLAFALGFTTAKLRTEMVRAPVLASELRYVPASGYVEEFEPRATGRARLTLRVLSLADLGPAERPYRVRISMVAKDERPHTGDAIALRATLNPPA